MAVYNITSLLRSAFPHALVSVIIGLHVEGVVIVVFMVWRISSPGGFFRSVIFSAHSPEVREHEVGKYLLSYLSVDTQAVHHFVSVSWGHRVAIK